MVNNKTSKNEVKKKKKRLNLKKVFILTLIILITAIIYKLSGKITVQGIEVSGIVNVSESSIIRNPIFDKSIPYFTYNESSICNSIKNNKLIKTCKIKRKLGFKLEIIVTENRPLFYYLDTQKLVLSNHEQIESTNLYGVPSLINYVPEKIFNKFIDGLNNVKSDIIRSVSEIEYTPSENKDGAYIDEERFMMNMKDGNIVYVNIRNIKVFDTYDKIYASLPDKKGYLNLDSDYNSYYFEEFKKDDKK